MTTTDSSAWKWYRAKYAKEKESFSAKEAVLRGYLQRAIEITEEMIDCKNNDCRCRQGFGPCNQCKEAALEWLSDLDKDKTLAQPKETARDLIDEALGDLHEVILASEDELPRVNAIHDKLVEAKHMIVTKVTKETA